MFTRKRGRTVARQRVARHLGADNENSDMVVGWVHIPPGGTVTDIHVNYDAIGRNPMKSVSRAHHTMLHGFLITGAAADHGYGNDISGLDSMWDDLIPKDLHQDLSLNEYTNDSWTDDSRATAVTDTGAIESGTEDDDDAGLNLQDVLNLGGAPECVFSRLQRHTINNSIITNSDEFTPTDHYSGRLNKNYHVPRDRFGYLLFGFGVPRYEVDQNIGPVINQGDEWLALMHPELSALKGLIQSADDHGNNAEILAGHLENWYVSTATYTDVNDDTHTEDYTVYLDLTVQYKRPAWRGSTLSAKGGLG